MQGRKQTHKRFTGRAQLDVSCARTHHKFLRTSLKFWSLVCLMTYMRSNAPALAPGRRAQGRKPTPKRVRTGPENAVLFMQAGAQKHKFTCAHSCKTLSLGHNYPPPMLSRGRESAIDDYAPPSFQRGAPRFPAQVHKQAFTRECARALTRAAGKW